MSRARAILTGAAVVGALDALDAIIFFGLRSNVAPGRIFQSIASGLLGRASFQGGSATVALGVLIHFTIAFSIVATYYLASRRFDVLTRRVVVCGFVYGVLVYLFMNLVVVPLSAVTRSSPPLPVIVNGVLIHLLGVGLPSAVFARAASVAPGG
jgi:hypothetical protein